MAFDKPGSGGSMNQINVTPLVDVMLVLLVIFMVTAPILQQGVAVDLPRAELGPLDSNEIPLVVSLTREGDLYLNEQKLTRAQLVTQLGGVADESADESVYVRADESLPYGEVISVMAAIREAGIRNVGMVTQLPSEAG
ncbi:MAG: protein TolR [Candidatus Binatia bacterium]|nr:protein TolR [Candidatus Binatia bacterium]